MGRFAFGKRRSAAESENDIAAPSFRVLERTDVSDGANFDGGARLSKKTHAMPQTSLSEISLEDNIFAELKPNTNRGSGSSNTTKTNSTDNSSRHSNASTTPSSADLNAQEEWKLANKRTLTEVPVPKSSPSGFMKGPGGRSWSFGAQKKQLPPVPTGNEPATPPVPEQYANNGGRARATTTSTEATITPEPPKVEEDFNLDLGGNFSKMLLGGFDKRSSIASVRDENGRQVLQPPAMSGSRLNQPLPLVIDKTAKVEAPLPSWNSRRSNDNLMSLNSPSSIVPSPTNENMPPPVPRHGVTARPQVRSNASSDNLMKRTSAFFGRRKSSMNALESPADEHVADEESKLLRDSIATVNQFMSAEPAPTYVPAHAPPPTAGKYRRNDDNDDEDNIFDTVPLNAPKHAAPRPPPPKVAAPGQHKVMTPAEFEQYRKEKETREKRAQMERTEKSDNEDEDEINYEDDEDEDEKSKQVAKQRRKQEAHMTVYRQQMMKVTGETGPARPPMHPSFSTPFLTPPETSKNPSEGSDDDEEVPLAILAAHGFPNKNKPPTRLQQMSSNPNLRQATQPSYQRPGSAMGGGAPIPGGPLPPFARGLPTDPYGLVNPSVRESFALGGGAPAGQHGGPSPGGLVGVIANEERSRAMRRGSPQVAQMDPSQGGMHPGGFDPMQGIPPQMMYQQQMGMPGMQNMMLTPGDQAQLHMTQQMQQFMQMQMQFMQMMAAGQNNTANGPPRSAGHMGNPSVSTMPGMNGMGMDFMGGVAEQPQGSGSMLDLPRPDVHGRTMSLVQPSSASWLQPPGAGYAPSIAPSERSNVGLPGRYRPVTHMAAGPAPDNVRTKSALSMSGALDNVDDGQTLKPAVKNSSKQTIRPVAADADEDDDEGWAAMKAKRDEKKSSWRLKKTIGASGIGSLIS